MYLGIACYVLKRKKARCRNGGCGKDIEKGEPAITVIRKGGKGRSYRWFHPQCFLGWAEFLYERNQRFQVKNPPQRSGRPAGGHVKSLFESNPELAQERHKCIRDQARFIRYLLATEDEERICKLTGKIDILRKRVSEILRFQVVQPGRRTSEDTQAVEAKLSLGRRLMHEATEPKQLRHVETPDKPAPIQRTPEEIAEWEARDKQMFADWERQRQSGVAVTVEDGAGQEDGGRVFKPWMEDGSTENG